MQLQKKKHKKYQLNSFNYQERSCVRQVQLTNILETSFGDLYFIRETYNLQQKKNYV